MITDIILCKRLIFGRLHLHNDASVIVTMAGWLTVVMRDFVKDIRMSIRIGACSFASSINLCISNLHISFGDDPSIIDPTRSEQRVAISLRRIRIIRLIIKRCTLGSIRHCLANAT